MKTTLIIFTNSFPYGHGETFIDNEVAFWERFDKVILISSETNLELRFKHLPTNVSICRIPKWGKIDKIRSVINALFRKEFYSELSAIWKPANLRIPRLRHLLAFIGAGLYLTSKLKNIIEQEIAEGNAVYLYSYWMNQLSYVSANLARMYNIPAITRAHRYDLYSERNELNYLPLRKYIANNLRGIYPISEDGRQYLEKRLNSKNKIQLSRLGTFDKGISPKPDNSNELTILSCSWVSAVKRLDRIIQALKLIQNKRIEWIHIGDGELFDSIKMQASTLAPNIKVSFKGAMTIDEIYQFYKETPIHYFVNVSESEGIPVSIMEATSMGIPAIATKVGGTSEIINDKINGFLLNEDYKAEELAKILQQESYPWQMREEARSIWDEKYNAEKNYTSFFGNLLQERN